jgi:Zn finger protein HypA/HybF involved in hydrogenase expression
MELTLGQFFLVLLALTLGAFFAVWFVTRMNFMRRKNAERARVQTCRICAVLYEAQRDEVSLCPACGSKNESTPQSGV